MNILFAAPHFMYPPRNADDQLIWDRTLLVKYKFKKIIILGKNHVIIFDKGKIEKIKKYSNTNKGKLLSALLSFFLRSNYKFCKFLTNDFIKEFSILFNLYRPKNVFISYLQTAVSLNQNKLLDKKTNYVCETHNNEWEWNENNKLELEKISLKLDLFKLSKLLKNLYILINNQICESSNEWLDKNTKLLPSNINLICLTNNDLKKTSLKLKDFKLFQIPPSAPKNINLQKYKSDKLNLSNYKFNLLFVGSLNMKMNIDAINNFFKKFYPIINESIGDKIELNIVGRNPSDKIINLSKIYKFNLLRNVSHEELIKLYQKSNLLLMPFSYTCGFKLKFLEALSNGIPILGTECVNYCLTKESLALSLFSNDSKKWLNHIKSLMSLNKLEFLEKRYLIQDYSRYFSTKIIASQIESVLQF